MAGQEAQPREEGTRRGTPAALSTHSSRRGRADPETGKDLPEDTQRIRLELDSKRSRENGGGNLRNREMGKETD